MIAVTGATGQLGKLVVEELLKKGTKSKDIAAIVRDKTKAADLAAKGIDVRVADYTAAAGLEKALAGVTKLLLISGNEMGQRLAQHTNVINAAKKAGVKQIVYTSILNADKSKMTLANEHLATEKAIAASGVPYVILRNSWYTENYTGQMKNFLQHGAIAGSAQNGSVSVASRADYAAAAVAVLLKDSKENKIYELAGPSVTLKELAQIISKASAKNVEYHDMPVEAYGQMLESVGLPKPIAQMLSDSDAGIARGDLFSKSDDLEKLIGRAPTPILKTIEAALKI